MKTNEADIDIAIDETKAEIARSNGDERQARIYEHAAQCAKWRRDSKKAVDRIEVPQRPMRSKPSAKRAAHTPDQVAQVMEASDRLSFVIEALRREGFGKDVLEIALVDVTVRLKKTYEPHQSPATLLHELSKMASDMAKDEEAEARTRIAKRRQEH
jgi:sRNA-binding protein